MLHSFTYLPTYLPTSLPISHPHHLPLYTHIQVGGALSVGYHGSQMSLGSISSVVTRMQVMDTYGHTHLLDANLPTDRPALAATSLGVGVCGIITRVTLPVVPTFHLR